MRLVQRGVRWLLPTWQDVRAGMRVILMAVVGAVVLFPYTRLLPVLGWDWYFFFTSHHPTDNVFSPASPFLPHTPLFFIPVQGMVWRDSLALMIALSLAVLAMATWRAGGRYGSIALALISPPVFMMMWVGHPDGASLLGVLSGFFPLALIKPQAMIWSYLRSPKMVVWLGLFGLAVLVFYPGWLSNVTGMGWDHSASFGWRVTGWPVAVIGLLMLAGAGSDPWRLMAAGCLLSPDLMPYHLVVLMPLVGKALGWRKLVIWFFAWVVLLGVGLGGEFRYFNLLLPIGGYWLTTSPREYWHNLRALPGTGLRLWKTFWQAVRQVQTEPVKADG